MTTFDRGARVRLTADVVDEFGQKFSAGQLGTIYTFDDEGVTVDFDGYEALRAQDAANRQKFGEGWNIVPWMAVVPEKLLEEFG